MGTHNYLLRLGAKAYLEVISIDPDAPRPVRARWFGLDDLAPDAPPRLAAWVARTEDIEAVAAASRVPLGILTPMSRGPLNWRITIPADGRPPMHGLLPSLIQWPHGIHPTANMPDIGCALVKLEGFHPDAAKISAAVMSIGFEGEFQVFAADAPSLVAHIRSPSGLQRLSSPI